MPEGFDITGDAVVYSQATSARPETPAVLFEIDQEIERLEKTIEHATMRLGRVLAPEYDTPSSSSHDAVPMPVVSDIRATQMGLVRAIDRLCAVLDRVEV